MNTKLWGRGFWYLIFLVLYNETDVEQAKAILHSICQLLPCEECRSHIFENVKANNIWESNDIEYIRRFFIAVHNNTASKTIVVP